jgi:hypothetical protein
LVYEYENFKYVNRDNKGVLYKDGRILFIGNSWSGIIQFLQYTNNAPEVRQMFRSQLEQREKPKYAKTEKTPE